MHRPGAVPLVGTLILLAFAGVDAQDDVDPLSAEERAWLDAHGPIRYAPDPAYPPFEFVADDGSVQGINVDFLNRISRNLDITFETVVLDNWTAVLEAMQAGEVDLLGSLAQTEDRDVYMDFYGPYMSVGEVFYVRADRTDLVTEQDLVGKQVAVVGSYAAATWLADNRPGLQQVPVDDIQSGLDALSTGQVDAFFENIPVTGYYIRDLSFSNIRILGEPLYFSPANWGVQEDNDILLSILDKGMASVPLGEQTAIFEYWTGYDLGVQQAPVDGPIFSPIAWTVLAGVGLVAATAAGFSWALRRQVKAQTAQLRTSRDALAEANDQLEHRVDERTRELSSASKRLADVHATLDRTTRATTMALTLFSRQMRSRYHGLVKPKDMDALDKAIKAATAVEDLVQDIGQLGASGPLDAKPVDVGHLLDAAGSRMSDVHPGRVDVEGAAGPVVGDPLALEQFAQNIVRHAIQTAPDEDVTITVSGSDGRIDIDHAARSEVLEAAGSLTEPLEASQDLSLAAAARIIHRHGGRMDVANRDGHLRIHVELPGQQGRAGSK